MKRGIIIIENKTVSVTGNEVWMTATEIAGLLHAGVPAVNAAIKAVRKSDVLNDYEVCRYKCNLQIFLCLFLEKLNMPQDTPVTNLL